MVFFDIGVVYSATVPNFNILNGLNFRAGYKFYKIQDNMVMTKAPWIVEAGMTVLFGMVSPSVSWYFVEAAVHPPILEYQPGQTPAVIIGLGLDSNGGIIYKAGVSAKVFLYR